MLYQPPEYPEVPPRVFFLPREPECSLQNSLHVTHTWRPTQFTVSTKYSTAYGDVAQHLPASPAAARKVVLLAN